MKGELFYFKAFILIPFLTEFTARMGSLFWHSSLLDVWFFFKKTVTTLPDLIVFISLIVSVIFNYYAN